MNKRIQAFMESGDIDAINSGLLSAKEDDEGENPIKEEKERVFTQYLVGKNSFRPAPDIATVKTLRPGVYRVEQDMQGIIFTVHDGRTDELLRFKDARYDEVLNEISKFWTLKETFDNYGFTHKRGILLYGDPGTGKSCLVKLVQEDVVRDGNVVFISGRSSGTLTEGLRALRDVEPDRKVLVILEDIDEIVCYNEHAILELFDGDSQVDNVLYLGTTNYIHKLPPRILRTGRFDRKLEIGTPPRNGRLAYLTAKLEGIEDASKIDELADKTKGFNFSQLREFMIGTFCLGYPEDKVIRQIRTGNEEYNVISESLTEAVLDGAMEMAKLRIKGKVSGEEIREMILNKLQGKRMITEVLKPGADARKLILG